MINKNGDIQILMYHQFVEKISDGGKIKLFITRKTLELRLKILIFLSVK